jgi:hypothetical protein
MNAKTNPPKNSKHEIPKILLKEDPWWVESTLFKSTILIEDDYSVIMVQRVKWLGNKYTVVNVFRGGLHVYKPQMWLLMPGWVWRKVKRMIEGGEGREKVVSFIGSAMVSYVGMDGEYRKDYEEPYRLLSIFF